MRALTWTATGITLIILAYAIRQPALAYIFHHNEEVRTPHGHTPKMRTWIKGVEQHGS